MNNRSRLLIYLLAALVTCSALVSQPQRAQESTPATPAIDKIALQQALLDLTNPWTVMCVAAHPDDEDGTTLIVLRHKYGVHTVSLFSTYGEGGQNGVGPELYEELGVIRAKETMAAAKIQGSEPYFLGLKDFGFSKSAEEAFRVWGHDEALRRMVLKIRELRPDVVITNHDTTSGHGHHQATGRLILEAFDAAADPKRFPEQLSQVSTWQIKRLFLRKFSSNQGSNQAPANPPGPDKRIVTIDPNEQDSLRGTIYAAQALEALQQHATQGPWPKSIEERLRAQGNKTGKLPLIRYQIVREAQNVLSLPENPSTFLDGLKLPPTVAANFSVPMIDDRPVTEFVDLPARVLDALIDWRAAHNSLANGTDGSTDDANRFELMAGRLSHALATASGITLSLSANNDVLVPGMKTAFSINLASSGDRPVQIRRLWFDSGDGAATMKTADQLLPDTETSATIDWTTLKGAKITVPEEEHLYDGLLFGRAVRANADLAVEGVSFTINTELRLNVAPAVEIKDISPSPFIWTTETLDRQWSFDLNIKNHLPTRFRGLIRISSATYPQIFSGEKEITLEPNQRLAVKVEDDTPAPLREPMGSRIRPGTLSIAIKLPELPQPVTERNVRSVYCDARTAKQLRVGYLPSFDETLAKSLAALGVESQELSVEDIKNGGLADYDTIIIDNRGYEAHPELIEANEKLLNFVSEGGTLIVFYHKNNEWNPNPARNRPQLAPYPIVLGDERVTEENAPVKFLKLQHPLLNHPNRITAADFKDWIQERGLYYPTEWDSHYEALLSTSDSGEAPLDGGLLVTRYGRGSYIYTSMVWYRQLRAGVPGGYRMFANMISYGHQGNRQRNPNRKQ